MPRRSNLRSAEPEVEPGNAPAAEAPPPPTPLQATMQGIYLTGLGRRAFLTDALAARKEKGFEEQRELFPWSLEGMTNLMRFAGLNPAIAQRAMVLDLRAFLLDHIGNIVWLQTPGKLRGKRLKVTWPKGVPTPAERPHTFLWAGQHAEVAHALWHGKIRVITDADPNEPVYEVQQWRLKLVWTQDVLEPRERQQDAARRAREAAGAAAQA